LAKFTRIDTDVMIATYLVVFNRYAS